MKTCHIDEPRAGLHALGKALSHMGIKLRLNTRDRLVEYSRKGQPWVRMEDTCYTKLIFSIAREYTYGEKDKPKDLYFPRGRFYDCMEALAQECEYDPGISHWKYYDALRDALSYLNIALRYNFGTCQVEFSRNDGVWAVITDTDYTAMQKEIADRFFVVERKRAKRMLFKDELLRDMVGLLADDNGYFPAKEE